MFQPLGVVAFNAMTKGLTSALLPILNNEQPTGPYYGSIPVDVSSIPGLGDSPGNPGQNLSSVTSSGSSMVTSLVSSLGGFFG